MAGNELSQGKAKRNLGQAAATASLVAAIMTWIIRAIYGGPQQSDTLETGKYYAEVLRIIVHLSGIVCAIVAFASIRKYGTRGILVAALPGLFWNSGYFMIVAPTSPPRSPIKNAPGRCTLFALRMKGSNTNSRG